MMKRAVVRILRRRAFQPMHERLLRVAKVGMNHWGGAEIDESGELEALAHVAARTTGSLPIVFDVGANTGSYALAAASRFPPSTVIHAFEPAAVAFQLLEERVLAAGLGERIVRHRFGLSDAPGSAMLHGPHPGSSIATIHPAPGQAEMPTRSKEVIELTTLDAFCTRHGIRHIDLLKVDAEGHEFAVLTGAATLLAQGAIKHIQFEFGERHIDARVFFRDIHQLLEPSYVVNRIVRNGLWPIPSYSPDLEVFNTANFLAFLKADHQGPSGRT